MDKIQTLLTIEGLGNEDEFLGSDKAFTVLMDTVNPGICMNPDCDYTTNVEPDSDSGWCEVCGTNTVTSLSMLLGII